MGLIFLHLIRLKFVLALTASVTPVEPALSCNSLSLFYTYAHDRHVGFRLGCSVVMQFDAVVHIFELTKVY